MTLPIRDTSALIEALRIRALALTGETWEREATRDMMKEAAQSLEDQQARTCDKCRWHDPADAENRAWCWHLKHCCSTVGNTCGAFAAKTEEGQ